MITIKLDKLYNRVRTAQPCYVSVPLAKGELHSAEKVMLFQGEKLLKHQTKVLSYYEDGSIRYLFLRFLCDIPANKGTTVNCKLQGADTSMEPAHPQTADLCCEQVGDEIHIATGKLSFTVKNGTESLFEEMKAFDTVYGKEQFTGPKIKAAGCKEDYDLSYGSWKVIEEGPVCAILSNRGMFRDGLPCEVRLTVYAGCSNVDTEVRLINESDEPFEISSYEFIYHTMEENLADKTGVRACVADSNYKTDYLYSENGETVEKEITAEKLLMQSNEHYAEVFYGTFFADVTTENGGVCATVYQAHQNFPKAVSAGTEGIHVKLVPKGAAPVMVQSGMAIAQQFQLYFHEKDEPIEEINHQTTMYQMPDRALLDPAVYEASGLYPDIFVAKEKQDSKVECALMMSADNHIRSYGMMNWGDAPDPHYTAQGRGDGRLVWTNNEYDFPHACMLEYIRTGVRRFFDYCVVAGTHQMNVDVCHYSKDELLRGGQWEHTDGHCFGEMACSHEWVEGLIDCYHLTGDERYLTTANGIGENVLRLLDTPKYQENGGLNARETGWALRTLTALYRETGEVRFTVKSDWIVEQFKEWAARFGGWLAPYTDNTAIRVPFMISVAVGSLMRYYREFPREDMKELILVAVDDMVENCIMDNGYFYYKELPSLSRVGNNPLVLEALAIAYELSGDKKYLMAGQKTFWANIESAMGGGSTAKKVTEDTVMMGNMGTKRFAQMMVPMATYYSALIKAEI